MLDLEQLQIIAQLIDNMELATQKLEKSFAENNGEEFTKSKQEILDSQKKISVVLVGDRKIK